MNRLPFLSSMMKLLADDGIEM
ncbi:MAG: hypothetical protein QG608_3683, partial [Actinomycetota bacterium]|nr:hypothetical protein [Actinomycetota bacterium]